MIWVSDDHKAAEKARAGPPPLLALKLWLLRCLAAALAWLGAAAPARVDGGPIDLSGDEFRRHLRSLRPAARGKAARAEELLGYDPTNVASLDAFAPLQVRSRCLFARAAKCWGAPPWLPQLSEQANVMRAAPALALFLDVGRGLALDGFVLELKGADVGDKRRFGPLVMRVLRALCDLDPHSTCRCMRTDYTGKYGWWFEFANEQVFLTTFAPFYPPTHSRHQYDAPKDSAFLLFQPEYSFAAKNISCGHEPTNWSAPTSARDKVRVNFLNAGQNYVHRPGIDDSNPEFVEQFEALGRKNGADQVYASGTMPNLNTHTFTAGETLVLAGGTYMVNGPVQISVAGVTVRAAPGATARIVVQTSDWAFDLREGADDVRLADLEFDTARGGAVISRGVSGAVLERLRIVGDTAGPSTRRPVRGVFVDSLFLSLVIENAPNTAIRLDSGSSGNVIAGCHIRGVGHHSSGAAIRIQSDSPGNHIVDNVLQNTNHPTVYIIASDNLSARNIVERNVIFNSDDFGIQACCFVEIRNNFVGMSSSRAIGIKPDGQVVRDLVVSGNTAFDLSGKAIDIQQTSVNVVIENNIAIGIMGCYMCSAETLAASSNNFFTAGSTAETKGTRTSAENIIVGAASLPTTEDAVKRTSDWTPFSIDWSPLPGVGAEATELGFDCQPKRNVGSGPLVSEKQICFCGSGWTTTTSTTTTTTTTTAAAAASTATTTPTTTISGTTPSGTVAPPGTTTPSGTTSTTSSASASTSLTTVSSLDSTTSTSSDSDTSSMTSSSSSIKSCSSSNATLVETASATATATTLAEDVIEGDAVAGDDGGLLAYILIGAGVLALCACVIVALAVFKKRSRRDRDADYSSDVEIESTRPQDIYTNTTEVLYGKSPLTGTGEYGRSPVYGTSQASRSSTYAPIAPFSNDEDATNYADVNDHASASAHYATIDAGSAAESVVYDRGFS